MNKLPFPEPQSDRIPIAFDQYLEYTPEKLELWDGFYNYGGQDMTGFHLAVLTNMGRGISDSIFNVMCNQKIALIYVNKNIFYFLLNEYYLKDSD